MIRAGLCIRHRKWPSPEGAFGVGRDSGGFSGLTQRLPATILTVCSSWPCIQTRQALEFSVCSVCLAPSAFAGAARVDLAGADAGPAAPMPSRRVFEAGARRFNAATAVIAPPPKAFLDRSLAHRSRRLTPSVTASPGVSSLSADPDHSGPVVHHPLGAYAPSHGARCLLLFIGDNDVEPDRNPAIPRNLPSGSDP